MMEERPAWLETLFELSVHLDWVEGAYTSFRQRQWKEWVLSRIEGVADGAEVLRHASLEELTSEDLHRVLRALMCLIVVGHPPDIAEIKPLLDHPEGRKDMPLRVETKGKTREKTNVRSSVMLVARRV